jgi:putative hydrolase of the HAD superfamily
MNTSVRAPTQKPKIVFDFAGVLFHWQPLKMLQREVPHLAPDAAAAAHVAQQIFQSYGGDWGHFDRGTVSVPDLVRRISQRTGYASADVQRVVEAIPRELQALPASVALVQRLHAAGYTLYFLSNMPAPYATHLEAQNPFLRCFTDGVFSARVHHNKPEPEIFALCEKRFGAQPQELLFMDDHLPNVLAAQQHGWQAFQFVDAAQAEHELGNLGIVLPDAARVDPPMKLRHHS